MEIFLTAVCLLSIVTLYGYYLVAPSVNQIIENQEIIKDALYLKSSKLDLVEHSRRVENHIYQIRTDLKLHFSELALKSDFQNLLEDAEKIAAIKKQEKEERFKNIQKAFSLKSKDDE